MEDKRFITILSTLGPMGEVNKVKWRVVALPKDKRTSSLGELRDVARSIIQKQIPGARVVVTDPPFVEGCRHRGADHGAGPRARLRHAGAARAPVRERPEGRARRHRRRHEVHAGRARAARRGRSRFARPGPASRSRALRSRCAPPSRATRPASSSGQGRHPDPRAPREGRSLDHGRRAQHDGLDPEGPGRAPGPRDRRARRRTKRDRASGSRASES